jgi:serine phosphatase RsbU (regulator of sigma subunit)/anti-sigma regulatory factor (Ser/Thr protein kinase)
LCSKLLSNQNQENKLQSIIESFKEKIHSKEELIEKLFEGLQYEFPSAQINIYLVDPTTLDIELTKSKEDIWPFPISEKEWLINKTKNKLLNNNKGTHQFQYIEDRFASLYVDREQLRIDRKRYSYPCSDGLYLLLISDDEVILGVVFINNWKNKKALIEIDDFPRKLEKSLLFINEVVLAMDNWVIHQKLESLLVDKHELKIRIQKDEEKLKRRILELSALYDISSSISSSLDYKTIVKQVSESLHKVLDCDISAMYLLDYVFEEEIIFQIHHRVSDDQVEIMKANMLSAIIPFFQEIPEQQNIEVTTYYNLTPDEPEIQGPIRSFANVPLIYKEEIIGILSICSATEDAFSRNEITFLHTLANQLASQLGRIKTVQEIEKSKISTVIESMTEGVVMIDKYNKVEIINPALKEHLNITTANTSIDEAVLAAFQELGLVADDNTIKIQKESILNKIIYFQEKILSVNITPVFNIDNELSGTVFVFRDVTEIQKTNRIKTQRLEVISKVSLLLNSISDLNNLLAILMEFILNVAQAEMGSIQLLNGNKFYTKVHSNFPDKIRRNYKLRSGETISDYVERKKEACILLDYMNNPKVLPNEKIFINTYVCLPLMVKNDLIGIVNVIRKVDSTRPKLSQDDIKTLMTITSLSSAAIHNATLYNEKIKRKALDQELKIAGEIQTKLLPSSLPKIDNYQFGAISIPTRGIGGDYYDFFALENGNIGIVLADIVGKGIPAGLFMAMLKSILHRNIPDHDSPQKAMAYINEILYKDQVFNKFVPLFFGILNPTNFTFKYCNAGHEPSMVFTDKGFETLDTKGFPLGAFVESDYEEKEITLKDQDIIVIFTDGIIEARDKDGKAFGHDQLQKTIKRNNRLSAEKMVSQIYTQIASKQNENAQHDDLTIVACKVDRKQGSIDPNSEPLEVKKFKIASSRTNIKIIRKEVGSIAQKMGFSETDIFNLKLAINEAQANIIEHVYMGNEDKEILIEFRIYNNRLEVLLKDFGKGYVQSTIKEGEQHLDILEGSGLGLFLIKSVMDNVRYNIIPKVGTELLLTKYVEKKES